MTNRELDALVAEKIFGWRAGNDPKQPWVKGWFTPDGAWYMGTPSFCDDISAAWAITSKICNTWIIRWDDSSSLWCVSCDHHRVVPEDCRFGAAEYEAPKAICLAALNACGVEVD